MLKPDLRRYNASASEGQYDGYWCSKRDVSARFTTLSNLSKMFEIDVVYGHSTPDAKRVVLARSRPSDKLMLASSWMVVQRSCQSIAHLLLKSIREVYGPHDFYVSSTSIFSFLPGLSAFHLHR